MDLPPTVRVIPERTILRYFMRFHHEPTDMYETRVVELANLSVNWSRLIQVDQPTVVGFRPSELGINFHVLKEEIYQACRGTDWRLKHAKVILDPEHATVFYRPRRHSFLELAKHALTWEVPYLDVRVDVSNATGYSRLRNMVMETVTYMLDQYRQNNPMDTLDNTMNTS